MSNVGRIASEELEHEIQVVVWLSNKKNYNKCKVVLTDSFGAVAGCIIFIFTLAVSLCFFSFQTCDPSVLDLFSSAATKNQTVRAGSI